LIIMNSFIKTTTKIAQNPNVKFTYINACIFGGWCGGVAGSCHWSDNLYYSKRMSFKKYDWYKKPIIGIIRGTEYISYVAFGSVVGAVTVAILPVSLPIILNSPYFRNEIKCIYEFK
jgi:hypothetical protein